MPRIDIRVRRVVAGLTAMLLATAGVVAVEAIAAGACSGGVPRDGQSVLARRRLHRSTRARTRCCRTRRPRAPSRPAARPPSHRARGPVHDHPRLRRNGRLRPACSSTAIRRASWSAATAPTSTGILGITSAGTRIPRSWATSRWCERDGPWQAFPRADWLRLNTNRPTSTRRPSSTRRTSSIPGDASPPTGTVGNGSIYTVDTSATAVADYVEANSDASWEEAQSCLDDIADPIGDVGYPVGVAEDVGSRVVLEELSPDQPNIVDYADIAGTALIQFSPRADPGRLEPSGHPRAGRHDRR